MKIAIAGYGMEGESSYRYWASDDNNVITIVDEHQPTRDIPKGVETIIGEGAFSRLDDFDLVIRTAGLSPEKIKTNGKIWSSTNEFFEVCPTEIIGVTGTKGKGTIASLIASFFEASGKKVWLVGNIGVSALDALEQIGSEDIVVYELSSFQLWDLQKSPQTAVVGMIESDHLNVHRNMDDYVNSKRNIRAHQSNDDICVYHPTNRYSRDIALSNSNGETVRYGISDDGGVYERDGEFLQNGEIICSTELLQLLGYHNIENACAAITVAMAHGVSIDSIKEGLRSFKGLPNRIEFVRKVEGIDYYNDSFSSTPGATVAAVRSFTQPEILILGGVDKGADFNELAETLSERNNIKEIVIIGEIKQKLAEILNRKSVDLKLSVLEAKTMEEIVQYSKSVAVSGDVVLLSPGCASFDMFRDFYDRGDQFKNIVNKL